MSEFKGTKVFPKFEGGDNYSIDMVFENEATISIDRRSRYTEQCNMSREEMEANAVLISKAPEMLETLKQAQSELRRIKSSMMAHPDCTEGSEFDDYTSSAERMENEIENVIKEATTI